VRCVRISCPLWSWICGLVHVGRLEESNKEEGELVGVAPHWGEPRISCVIVLCAMCSWCLCLYLFSTLFMTYDR
jgi:hypothetical protein